MKRGKRFATAMAILSVAAVLTGCGKSDPNEIPPPGGIPRWIPGYPGYGNACVPLTNGYGSYPGYGGQTTQGTIGFNAMNIYWDGRAIVAGNVPYKSPSGQVTIGQGGQGGPYTRSGVDGVLSMQITQNAAYGGYPQQPQYPQYGGTYGGQTSATTANATGMVQISSAVLQEIITRYGGYSGGYQQPYNPYQPGGMPQPYQPYQQPQTCVSGLAIEGNWSPTGGFYNTWVYLYMNNTQHGERLYF